MSYLLEQTPSTVFFAAVMDELYTKGQVNFPAAILVKSLSLPCVGPLIDRSLWGAAVPTSGYPREIAGMQHI